MFIRGQKVACINADIHPKWLIFVQPLIKDNIYTIRDIVPGSNTTGKIDDEIEVAVYLEEIHNTINEGGIERGYNAERFVPLQEQEVYEVEKIKQPKKQELVEV